MHYKLLKTEFESKGFKFKQIERNGDAAIYLKTKGNWKGWEVIKISRHNGYTLGGSIIEPSETYPSSSMWGQSGFTYFFEDKQFAYKKFNEFVNIQNKT